MNKHITLLILGLLSCLTTFAIQRQSFVLIKSNNSFYFTQLDEEFVKADSYLSLNQEKDSRLLEFKDVGDALAVSNCPTSDITQDTDAGLCSAVVNFTIPTTDLAMGSMVLTTALGSGDTFPIGTTTVTYEERDNADSPTGETCSFNVIIEDNEEPALTGTAYSGLTNINSCLANATTAAPFDASLAVSGYTDNCSGPLTAALTNTGTSGTDNAWTVTYTFTVSDANGNDLTGQTYTNTGGDSTAPTLTGTAYTGTTGTDTCSADAATAAPFDAGLATNGYTDNCGGAVSATLTNTSVAGDDSSWTVTYTFTISDSNGNDLTGQTYTNTGGDSTAPTLTGTAYAGTTGTDTCSADAATSAPFDSSLATSGYTDNCGGAVSATLTNTSVTGDDSSWTVTYTFTISDANGNDLTGQTYTNTGGDSTAPTLTGTAYTGTTGTDTCSADAETAAPFDATLATNGYTDNCGGAVSATLTNTTVAGDDSSWTVTYTFTVSDANGNDLAGQTYTNTGGDSTAPAVVTQNITIALDASGSASIVPSDVDNGSSDACGTVNLVSVSPNTFDCSNVGDNTVTLTVNDGNGQTASAVATVTVEDNIAPNAIAQNFTAQLDASGNATITAADIDNGSSDNCGTPALSLSQTAFTCADLGDNTVTLTADDGNGQTATATATVTVVDNTPPTAVTQNITIGLDASGSASIVPSDVDNGSADSCGTVNLVSVSPNTFDCSNVGDNTVTLNVNDGNGQTATAVATVTVEDNINPTASNPAPINVQCSADVPSPDINDVMDENDNCGTPTVAFVSDVSDGNSNPEVITRTYSVTDGSGNSINVTQTITVNDTINPVASCIGGTTTITLDNSGVATISTATVDNGSSDNCGPVNLSFIGGSPDFTNNIALGKPASQSSTGFGGVPSRAVDGNTSGNWGGGSVTHTNTGVGEWWEVDLEGDFGIAAMRIWNRTDNCCSNRLNNFRITLYDGATVVASQDFTTQPNPSLEITSLTGTADRIRVTQLKNAPLSIAEFQVYTSGGGAFEFDCSDLGPQTITMVATDEAGNTSQCTHNVNVVDNIDPTITCPPDVTVNIDNDTSCEADASSVSLGTPTTNDNCSVASLTNDAPASYPVGDTTVTWTVTDDSGNDATCTQIVTVIDNADPQITCPANVTADASSGDCFASIALAVPTIEDCSSTNLTWEMSGATNNGGTGTGPVPSPYTFNVGVTTISYQVLDSANLLATCSFTVTINDSEPPVINAASDVSVSTDASNCSANININDAVISDNCTNTSLSWVITGATALTGTGQVGNRDFNLGISTITYTVTDDAGNSNTDTLEVEVIDDIDPIITCPDDITVSADANCEVLAISLGAPTTSDNCGVASVTNDAPASYGIGTTIVTWTVTDNSGATSTCEQTVTVEDNTNPTITLNSTAITANTSSEADYNCTVDVVIPNANASDNCPGSTLTWEMTGATNDGGTGTGQIPSPYEFNVGATTIIYTITDNSSPVRTSTASLTVTVLDDEDPIISGVPSNINVSNDPGVCGANISWVEPSESDNCAVTSFVQTTGFSNPYLFPIGTTTITYEAVDASGNSTTESFTVTVEDTEQPTISHPNESSDLLANTSDDGTGNCDVAIAVPDAVINDNCTISDLTWDISGATTFTGGSGQVGTRTFAVGTSTITYTIFDDNSPALQNTISIDIVVSDDELPSLNLPADITVNSCNTIVNYTVTGNDNCSVDTIVQIGDLTYTSGDSFPTGTTAQTYRITDIYGNVFEDDFNITVIDDVLPIVNCPSNVTLDNDAGLCSAQYNYEVTASDDCSASPALTWTMTGAVTDSGSGQIGNYDFSIGTTTVSYTVNDGANTDTCSSTVTVIDNETPILTCPSPNATYVTDLDECNTTLSFTATATDNCDTNPTVVYTIGGTVISFPYDFPIGTTLVDVSATDTAGNSDSCSFNVVVEDNQDPVLTCPTVASSYPTDSGNCFASLSLPASATDNCDASPVINYTIGGTPITFPYDFPSGSTTVIASVNDGNGQSDTCDYIVVVEDVEDPIAICQDLTITLDEFGDATISPAAINNNSTDNCGIQNITLNKSSFDCNDLGVNTVTMTVFDTSNNSSTCTATVTVLDPASSSSVVISVDNNPICFGEDIEFTASPTNGGASPTFEWFINGVSQGFGSSTFVPFIAINDGDIVYVRMQSSLSSCNTPTQSNSIVMTVNPIPVLTAPTEICLGESANLTPNSGGIWTSSNPSIATINNVGEVNAVSAGTVTFTYTSSSTGCSETTAPITINPLPALTQPTTICVGATANLTPSSGGTWISNNPALASIDNTGLVTGVDFGFVTFTFTDANGCQNTTATVEILESPVIDTINSSASPACAGEPITLEAVVQPSSNPGTIRTLVNYTFDANNNSYTDLIADGNEIPGIQSNMLSSTMTFNIGQNGAESTGLGAFTTNIPTPMGSDINGRSLRQRDDAGFDDDGDWIFDVSGSVLDQYRNFKVYFQTKKDNSAGNPKIIDISYRVNGTGGFTDLLQYEIPFLPGNNNSASGWNEILLSLPTDADNASQLEIKLYVNDGRNRNNNRPDVRIDNFQLQGLTGGDIVLYSWSADTGASSGLPASAEIPSSNNSIVQVNPSVETNYTLTVENQANGCSDTQTINIPVNPGLNLFVTADYCPLDDPSTPDVDETQLVQLVATSDQDPNVTYQWLTNPVQTGNTIYVDIADVYTVIATDTNSGCIEEGTVGVSQELVIDGDFTNLDPMDDSAYPFTSEQIFVPNQPGLVPANQGELWADGGLLGYTLTEDGNDTHRNFRGLDHTQNVDGPRQFMAINGDGGITADNQIDVWRQSNTPVLPNTTYYFSAWAMRLIGGNPPILRFKINGVEVGTTLTPTNERDSNNNYIWERFYGTYTTGPTETTADIFIVNLNGSQGGNDFGLDDISFATLSTFIRLTTPVDSDAQTVCQFSEIDPISYDVGGGLSFDASGNITPPEIEWVKDGTPLGTDVYPAGLSFIFNGTSYIISGTPTEFGSYSYELSTASACDVKVAEGTLEVEEAPRVTIDNVIEPICFSGGQIDLSATFGGTATSGTWSSSGDGNFTGVSGDGSLASYNFGPSDTTGIVTLTITTNDPSGICEPASTTYDLEITPFIVADAGENISIPDCSITTTNPLAANDVVGSWSVTSGQSVSSYFFSDTSAHDATFTGESGETYTLQWEAENIAPCLNSVSTITVAFGDCGNNIDFDGTDDYISFADNYDMSSGAFSLEAWIKADNVTGSKTIISKRDASDLTTGYDLSLVNNRIRLRWNTNGQIISTGALNNSRWYHVAATFDGGSNYNLYIDGIDVGSTVSGTAPLSNSNRFLIGAMDRTSLAPLNFYGGEIDEVRIWDVALTQAQIQQMMNQEIEANGTNVRGMIVPQDIQGLQWNNLMGYYQMLAGSQSSITSGNIDDIATNVVNPGRLNSMTSLQTETAPLPYISSNNGNWDNNANWTNGSVQQIPNSAVNSITGIAPTWNIVRTQHNITTNRPIVVGGLLVESNELSVINDQPLRVNRYLLIDGKIDLEGESQLLQPTGSIVDNASTGDLERDQQGTTNLFNYNYWGSPVNDGGSTFTIGGTLNDAQDANNPVPVNWISAFNAIGNTMPISLSRRWLYTYKNFPEASYASWEQVEENTPLDVGQGFTMKGSGSAASEHNYTFIGRPNNGNITAPLSSGNYQALVGNPYPSALDGNDFIIDNSGVLETGALNFWEHAPSNNSHVLSQYEGGYAVYNLSGGLPAASPPSEIGGLGNANKIPGRYVPIAQGFFVTGNAAGGNIIFQNSQRIFRKESASSVFLRLSTGTGLEETVEEDTDRIRRIRIDFNSPEDAVRHLMIAFVENGNATDGVDYGYDAPNDDNFPSDMSFDIDGEAYVIQGVGPFDETRSYPLIVNLGVKGQFRIELNDVEEFDDEDLQVFIYDSQLDTYTNFNNLPFEMSLPAGEYVDRFFLTFQEDETLSVIENQVKDIIVNYLQDTDEILIQTPKGINAKQIYLINIAGQTVGSWNSTNLPMSNEIRIPIKNIAEGNYVVKVETNYNSHNKKIIIKY